MADSFSSRLRQRLQQTGGNRNTWGGQLNSAALQLLEDAICGEADVTVAGVDVTLSTGNGANDQARMAIINLEGAPGASRNIIVPLVSKWYIVVNNTGFSQTVKTSSGAGVVIPAGVRQFVMCDGDDVLSVSATSLGTVANADALGGFAASAYARKNAFNQFTKGFAVSFVTLADGGIVNLDASLSNKFFLSIGGNRTLNISGASDGQDIEIWVKQDVTGGRTLALPGTVELDSDSATGLSGVSLGIDVIELTYNAAQNKFKGRIGGANASATTSLNITSNAVDLDIYAMAGSPAGVVTVSVEVSAGVVVQSLSTLTPAMDFRGFAAGSTINLLVRGYILGRGGRGNEGGFVAAEFAGPGVIVRGKSRNGLPGGPAIFGPGVSRTFNITNAAGHIWGGGGGGGGGGASADSASGDRAAGGGGGGGAGGGQPGRGGTCGHHTETTILAGDGIQGGTGIKGAQGVGGAGADGGSASGSAGGSGGDWGTVGSAGVAAGGGFVRSEAAGTGGAAGKAVDENGGVANFVSGSGSPNVEGAVS